MHKALAHPSLTMMTTTVMFLFKMLLLMTVLPSYVQSQLNPAFANDPVSNNVGTQNFFFDSNSDCNQKQVRELYLNTEANIRGNDISSTRLGPTSCTIKLRASSQFQGTILNIDVISMNILDCTTQVAIYDGDGAQVPLMSYDCRSSSGQNMRRFRTSGDTATFIMSRQNVNAFNFDIHIKVTPVRGGFLPGDNSNNLDNQPYIFDKFDQDIIVILIMVVYGIVLGICIILIIYCKFRISGLNKEWETHQLATLKTGSNFEDRSQFQPSVIEMSQQRPAQVSQGYSRPYPRKFGAPSEDGDSGVFYNDDAFQKRKLMNEEERNRPPRYATNNQSFLEPEDDPDHFVEKVITPRVHTNRRRNPRPPSYEEATSERSSVEMSEEESEVSSSNTSIRKRPLSSDEERSHSRSSRSTTSRSYATESEEETESDTSSQPRGARARRQRRKPRKPKRKGSRDDESDRPSRNNRPQQVVAPPPMQPMPYAPGQFIPMMAGPPQFQPVQMVPTYPPPHYPNEQYSDESAPRAPQVQPTDPPVYSYLVRRGYQPVDGRSDSAASAAASQRSGGRRLEEPDIRLDSGVEYMRR